MDTPKRKWPPTRGKVERAKQHFSPFHSNAPVDRVLDALDRVKATGPGRWLASCPTSAHKHGDRSRGLSIREGDEGRVLIHCFAGCAVDEIVAAIGLQLQDLFPAREITYPTRTPRGELIGRPRFRHIPWPDVFEAMEHRLWVCALAFSDLAKGKPFSPEDAASISRLALDMATEVSALRHPDKMKQVFKDADAASKGVTP